PRPRWLGEPRSRPDHSRTRQELVHLGHQVLRLGPADRAAGYQRDVESLPNPGRELTPRRPQHTPRPVPDHRPSDAAAGNERHVPRAGRDKHYHPGSVHRCSFGEKATHIRAARAPGPTRRAWLGPWHAYARGSRAPPGSASGGGTRASSFAFGYLAGRFAWTSRFLEVRGVHGRPAGRVYERGSAAHKGGPGLRRRRKTVKSGSATTPVEKAGAIVRRLPHPAPTQFPARGRFPSPRGFPHVWKEVVDSYGHRILRASGRSGVG